MKLFRFVKPHTYSIEPQRSMTYWFLETELILLVLVNVKKKWIGFRC